MMNDTPIIFEMAGFQNRHVALVDEIDTSNIDEIYRWCRSYQRNRPDKDTGDFLIRWNIGQYQLLNVYKMKDIKNTTATALDIGESVCSSAIHTMMAAFILRLPVEFEKLDKKFTLGYDEGLYVLTIIGYAITRQLIYKKMRRLNRYRKEELTRDLQNYVDTLVAMVLPKHRAKTFALAMGKLQDCELRGH